MRFCTNFSFSKGLLLALLSALFATNTALQAQTIYPINSSNNISTCSGIFTDDGGTEGDHSPGASDTITICSNSGASNASHIRLTFTQFIISGALEVYNGPTVDPATLVNTLEEASNNTNPVLEASARNASGCLTLVYTGGGAAPGWQAIISCVRACQPVIASLSASDPAVMPVDTGYIDVCIGETISFTGAGFYPESGFIYEQSDANSTFRWTFADGRNALGSTVSHAYTEAGGYTVQLTITDQNGCSNNNQISQRVRVAPRPTFTQQTDIPSVVCVGDTLTLSASTQFNPDPASQLFIGTTQQGFAVRQLLADTTFLPDGSGVVYTTSLEFNNFQPGQVVSSVSDVESICINMEHSYAGDLDIWIECPNGQEVYLVRFGGIFGQFVGEPIDLDDLQQGVGYDYCWTAAAAQTWDEIVAQTPIPGGQSIPAGDYRPEDNMAGLIGCPLNGEWSINVRDNLSIDNGWIFGWGVTFAGYLVPGLESFTVGFQEAAWQTSDDLLTYSEQLITAAPLAAGSASYTYVVTDDFGCVHDTTLLVTILPFSHPDCYDCQPMLDNNQQVVDTTPGTITPTTLASQTSLDTAILFRNNPAVPFGNALYPSLGGAYRNVIRVNSIAPATITNISQLESICVNINTQNVGGIRLFVMPPNGAFFELSTANGGMGANYTNTCFSPSATIPIIMATPPFTGSFLPEGNFNNLIGTPINGNWTLIVYHVGIGTPLGEFLDWSISFNHSNPLTYSWTPDDGALSCTDCPNPTVTAAMTNTAYQVVVTDAYGCAETGTLSVNTAVTVTLAFTSTNVDCAGAANGTASVEASNGTEPYTYAWSNGQTTPTINNLAPGIYTVVVTDANGNAAQGSVTITSPDAIQIDLISQTNVLCAGDQNGSLGVIVSGGTAPYTILWSNEATTESIGDLAAGTYSISVTDANGCVSEQTYTIETPAPLEASVEVTNILCGDSGNTGALNVTVSGNTSPYTYAWSNGATTEDLSDLAPGDYTLTITDVNGCTIELSATISQPTGLALTTEVTNVACFGEASGAIDLSVEGGQAPYTFAWSNGAATEDLSALEAGTYSVVVTDAGSCSATVSIEITTPTALSLGSSIQDLACNGDQGGSIELSVSGGTAPYIFLWSDGATDEDRGSLAAGTYSVEITDANGCTIGATFTIAQPEALLIAFAVTDASCAGEASGSIIVSVAGGTPPASFIWSTGATTQDLSALSAGTYGLTVTDINGCAASGEATVNEPSAITLSSSITNVACNGESSGAIGLSVAGGTAPYTYLWSNGATTPSLSDVAAGTYSVVVTDANNCTATLGGVVITQPSLLTCSIAITQEAFNNNDGALEATVGGGVGPYTFLWSNGATTGSISDLVPGTYTFSVTDANGCTSTCTATLRAYAGVGDFVFFDMNRDGIQDIGEAGIGGVTVMITATDGTFFQTQQTDALGRYEFRVLPGNYWISFSRPTGLVASPQNQGTNDALDSDINPTTLTTDIISLVAFGNNYNVDAGFYDPCNPGLTGAGTIGFSQEICGPGNTPDLLVETSPITGTINGVIEYMWMRKTGDPMDTPINNWTPIPNSNSVNYQPGPVSETTYFARCVRIDNCPFLESNFIEVTVGDDALASISGPELVCTQETVTFTAVGPTAAASVNWSFSGNSPVVLSQTATSISVRWTSFGQANVALSVVENNCTATAQQAVSVSANQGNCFNGLTNPENSRSASTTSYLGQSAVLSPRSTIYPNPASLNKLVVLELVEGYDLDQPIQLEIYDATGRNISFQETGFGRSRIQLGLFNTQPSGLYLVRVRQAGSTETHRLILR